MEGSIENTEWRSQSLFCCTLAGSTASGMRAKRGGLGVGWSGRSRKGASAWIFYLR